MIEMPDLKENDSNTIPDDKEIDEPTDFHDFNEDYHETDAPM